MSSVLVTYRDIDDCLGPASSRYFGNGFRRVERWIGDVHIQPAEVGGTVSARADLVYPVDWSRRSAADAPRPHLSTIDALLVAVQAAEAYLAHQHELDAGMRSRMWLRGFEMRAGAVPQEDLTDIAVRGVLRDVQPSPDGLRAAVSRFDFRVGTIRLSLNVEHDLGGQGSKPATWFDIDQVLGGSAARHYGRGFADRKQRITDIEVDLSAGAIRALIHVGTPPAGSANGRVPAGFASHYEPSLSMLDATISLAQVAQALMYEVDGVERRETGTLWMRRLGMTARTPYQPLANAFVTSAEVVGSKRVDRATAAWRICTLDGQFQGIRATASLAFTRPRP
jgi:hypothetical protein